MEKKDTDAEKIERRWRKIQQHLGFDEQELATFRSKPSHVKAMERAPKFSTHVMRVEIVEAEHCGAGYKVGDTFLVDGDGCLVPGQSPPRICVAAMWSLKPLVDRMWEAFLNDTTEILHDSIHCPDVGVDKGGAGRILMRIRAVPKKDVGL
ncbi:MAG: hypothetical protein A2X52_20760 [Candidatus Rokubacteria bacterium GWC2_70_16]|nr:MAG: hypothetical protein A2X52_20760 [Candidatus Rokubacteria bacterium GWC2_70_16]OGL18281.1 MAG: hypothetical protein A3K12_11025 [Candidatus Rokubacteria bacterium RIFCSPLOWO2_12_FULL_71_19]